jgi:hypothetical protein
VNVESAAEMFEAVKARLPECRLPDNGGGGRRLHAAVSDEIENEEDRADKDHQNSSPPMTF